MVLIIRNLYIVQIKNYKISFFECQWRRQIVPDGGLKVYQSG